jgi:hypothetical protein
MKAGDKTMKLNKRIAIATLVIAPSVAAPAWSEGTARQTGCMHARCAQALQYRLVQI